MIELMVAGVILSFIMISFFTIFRSGTAVWQAENIRVELVQNGRIALDRMVSEIRQALPPDSEAVPEIKGVRVCSGSDTNKVIGEPGDRLIFEAALDGEEGAEEIRFSRLITGDISSAILSTSSPTAVLYKRVDNPPLYDDEGVEIPDTNPDPHSYELTAGSMVTGLTFTEAKLPAAVVTKPVLITINLTLEDRGEKVTLATKVKVAYAYGRGLSL